MKNETALPKEPKSFSDLKRDELIAAANFYGTEIEGNIDSIRADLQANSVTWDMYSTDILKKTTTVTEELISDGPTVVEKEVTTTVVEPVMNIATASPTAQLAGGQKYLIKMTRNNPYFEFENYRFTQEKPYAIMDAESAQRILENEEDFRQAFPKELQDYYS